MKKIHILVVLLFISVVSFSQESDPVLDDFGKAFIQALQTKDADKLLVLKPSAEIWRKALPQETKKLTDEQIIAMANKNEKFYNDFKNIMLSAQKEQVELNKISYKSYKLGDTDVGPKLFGVTFIYEYKKNELTFDLSLLTYEKNYYLSEILVSYDIFTRNLLNKNFLEKDE